MTKRFSHSPMKHRYILRISFNDYVGNFQREFDAHVLNYINDYYSGVLNAAIFYENKNLDSDELHDIIEPVYEDNNDLTYSLMQSERVLSISFTKDPIKFLPSILERIKDFCAEYINSDVWANKKLKVIKIRYFKEVTTETELHLDIVTKKQ